MSGVEYAVHFNSSFPRRWESNNCVADRKQEPKSLDDSLHSPLRRWPSDISRAAGSSYLRGNDGYWRGRVR